MLPNDQDPFSEPMIFYLIRVSLGQCSYRAVGCELLLGERFDQRLGERFGQATTAFREREPRPTKLLSPFPEIVHQSEDFLPGLEHLGDPLVDREREFAFCISKPVSRGEGA